MKNRLFCFILFLIFMLSIMNVYGDSEKIARLDLKKIKMLEISKIYSEKVKKLNEFTNPGKQYLLLIGIDKYQNRLPLDINVSNAKELRNILYEEYYINNVIELFNEDATKENIENIFKSLNNILSFNDSIIIFYGGHGYIDPKTNKGYWIPYDGGINEVIKDKWIPNEDIKGYISFLQAAHVLLISDSCFSNDLIIPDNSSIKEFEEEHFKMIIKNKSRQVLGSGVNESESADSEFIMRVKKFFKNYNKSYLDPVMIYNNIKLNIDPTPIFGELSGSGHTKGSSFILFKRENDPVAKEELTKFDKKERIKDQTTDSLTKEKTEKLSKNEEKIGLKEEELRIKEEELKKQQEDILPIVYAKIINNVGIVLCPIGITMILSGIAILVVDLTFYSRELENMKQQLKNDKIQYYQYEKVYNNYIGLIVAGVALSAVGLILVVVSIPLMVYKKDFKTKKLSLNFDLGKDTNIYLSYKF